MWRWNFVLPYAARAKPTFKVLWSAEFLSNNGTKFLIFIFKSSNDLTLYFGLILPGLFNQFKLLNKKKKKIQIQQENHIHQVLILSSMGGSVM